jgi:chromatin segregation and condensation protein Rec8/ScpA/Scc1 (kleisin family)
LLQTEIKLSELFQKSKSKIEIVVIFLAILELAKMKEIIVKQNVEFEDIMISRNKENIIPYERRDQTHTA